MSPTETMIRRLLEQSRLDGYLDGLEAFAWWKDGIQYVGTTGTTLADAIALAKAGKLWNQQHYHLPGMTTPSEERPG